MNIQSPHRRLIRPLEGYRALAILAVLLFHLDKTLLPGGYLGVDLFFVISGFIITKGIIRERAAGTFKLSTFYTKRFRRLFPALLVTTLITLIFSYFILSPERYADTGKSAIFSLFSLANINFWMEAGYFDAASTTKPLLHMWSLSVEEQFYVFWPFIIVLFAPKNWKIWAVALFILSFSATVIFATRSPETTFFWFPFRIYEFMGGAILSILGLRLKNNILSTLVLLCGAVIFIVACVVFDEATNIALTGGVTVFACMLLLISMENKTAELIFGNPVFVWIGQRSYSIYLVHWPLIILYVYKFGDLSLSHKIGLGLTALILGMVLRWAIEEPFRQSSHPRSMPSKRAYPPLIGVMAITYFSASLIWGYDGIPRKLDFEIESLLTEDKRFLPAMRRGTCYLSRDETLKDLDTLCHKPDPTKKNALLIGSSFAADLNYGLEVSLTDWNVSQITMQACQPSMSGRGTTSCQNIRDHIYQKVVKSGDFEIVIISGLGKNVPPKIIREIEHYMNGLEQDYVFVGARPAFFEHPRDLIAKHGNVTGLDAFMRQNLRLQEELVVRNPEVHYYSSIGAFCGEEKLCQWQEKGALFYQDKNHLSPAGSLYLGEQFAKWLNEREK